MLKTNKQKTLMIDLLDFSPRTCTDADVGNVRICVTETSFKTCPLFCIVVVLLFDGCVPRISPSSSDSGRIVNNG